MSEIKDIKTKSDLIDSFVQIAITKGYSDYDGEAERFINETVDIYNNLSQPRLTIRKSIAEELKEAIGPTNFECTPYSVRVDGDGYLKLWASLRGKKLSEKAYEFCRDNTRAFDAYLNPLTRDLVKVVSE